MGSIEGLKLSILCHTKPMFSRSTGLDVGNAFFESRVELRKLSF